MPDHPPKQEATHVQPDAPADPKGRALPSALTCAPPQSIKAEVFVSRKPENASKLAIHTHDYYPYQGEEKLTRTRQLFQTLAKPRARQGLETTMAIAARRPDSGEPTAEENRARFRKGQG